METNEKKCNTPLKDEGWFNYGKARVYEEAIVRGKVEASENLKGETL